MWRGALGLDDIKHVVRQPLPARQMDRQRHAGDARGARRSPQRLAFFGGEILADADLADQPGHDRRLRPAAADVVDDELGNGVHIHRLQPFGMGVLKIEAGAHDDLQAGHAADAGELFGVAADADIGGIDDGVAARRAIALQLRQRQVGVVERDVVAVDVRVHAQLADDLDVHRLLGDRHVVGVAGAFPAARAIEQDVLVHQRDAHLLDRNRAEHGHHMAGCDPDWQPLGGHCVIEQTAHRLNGSARRRGRGGSSARWRSG